jgi:hypothetical protein
VGKGGSNSSQGAAAANLAVAEKKDMQMELGEAVAKERESPHAQKKETTPEQRESRRHHAGAFGKLLGNPFSTQGIKRRPGVYWALWFNNRGVEGGLGSATSLSALAVAGFSVLSKQPS